MADEPVSFLVVGAGVFGASTALALARRYPSKSVVLVDRAFPCKQSASWDWSKVICADYLDIFYTKLALEAKEAWRSDPLYSEHYHETGMLWVDDSGFSRDVIENYRTLGADEQCSMVTVEDLKTRYSGIFADAEFGDRHEVYLNESSGWAEASKALTAVIQAAASAGVRLVAGEVSTLTLSLREGGGRCLGVKTAGGQALLSETTILATGAETARLLVASAPHAPDLHVGGRLVAAGLLTGVLQLDPDEASRYQDTPSFLHAGGRAQGGVIPPNAQNELKITSDRSFVNTTEVAPQIFVSAPPTDWEVVQESLEEVMQAELAIVSDAVIGAQARHKEFLDCRICWDTITPTQDLLLTAHPHCENLSVAAGGSFHSWKFLPVIGKYVVQMLEGTLAPEEARRWAWDCQNTHAANKKMFPTREMADLLGGRKGAQ